MKFKLPALVMLFLICWMNAYAEQEELIEVKKTEKVIWKREISIGYDASRGNTETDQFSAGLFINRNDVHVDEITLKGDTYYSRVNKQADAQKWYGMGRYAFSFGKTKHWYNFYRIEGEHDRFANIDYRIIPAAGVGYWFFDEPKLKFLAETGIGFERTGYKTEEETADEVIITPRLFFESEVFDNVKISHDVYVYPAADFSEYRLHSESAITAAINKHFSLRLSVFDDYNSDPPEETKKNDMRFVSSLVVSF